MSKLDTNARRQLVAEAMRRRERGDLEGSLELIQPDWEGWFSGTVLPGIEQWSDFQRVYLAAFPDGAYEVAHNEPVDELVFVEGRMVSTPHRSACDA